MEKKQELYSGKAKSVFATDNDDFVVLSFRDDTSAFDGEKVEQLSRKGEINNKFNAFIMQYLADNGVPTHFESLINDTESVVKNMAMIPVECVVRNVATGSLVRRLGVEDGMELNPPVFEFFLKNDALHDPMSTSFILRLSAGPQRVMSAK
jgi:phosphoribosylaminoimidazole-succinocarboxamide synthase